MEGLKSRAVALIVCIALILVGWFGGSALQNSTGSLITCQAAGMKNGTTVMTVGTQEVAAGEYLYWLATTCDSFYQYYGITDWDQALTGDLTVGDYAKEQADYYVSQYAAIRQMASELDVSMTEEQLAELDTMDDYYIDSYGSEEMYEYMLAYAGLNRDTLRYNTEHSYLFAAIYENLLGEGGALEPTAENLAAWAERNGYASLGEEEQLAYYQDANYGYGVIFEYVDNYIGDMAVETTAAYDALDVGAFYAALQEKRVALPVPGAEDGSVSE